MRDLKLSSKFLNPISGESSRSSSQEICKRIEEKMKGFIKSDEFKESCAKILRELSNNDDAHYRSEIVKSEEDIIKFSKGGYDCHPLGNGRCQ